MNRLATKHHYICPASWILYATSLLGLLNLLTLTPMLHNHRMLAVPDLVAYSTLIVFAYFINKGSHIAKLFYAIIAFIWYTALLVFLPSNFHHPLNVATVCAQITLTVVALYLAYTAQEQKEPPSPDNIS